MVSKKRSKNRGTWINRVNHRACSNQANRKERKHSSARPAIRRYRQRRISANVAGNGRWRDNAASVMARFGMDRSSALPVAIHRQASCVKPAIPFRNLIIAQPVIRPFRKDRANS